MTHPGAPFNSLASCSIISYFAGLAETTTTGHDDVGFVELRSAGLLDVHGIDLCRAGRTEVGNGRRHDLGRAAARGFGGEALRPERGEVRAVAGERRGDRARCHRTSAS